MKPHPRIRKTVKWGGAVVTALLVVVWIGSGWFFFQWGAKSGDGGVLRDGVVFTTWTVQQPVQQGSWPGASARMSFYPGFNGDWKPFAFSWAIDGGRGWASRWLLIPRWPFLLVSFGIVVTAWRLETLVRRRARVGRCPMCSYDRTGLTAGVVCPECGSGGVPS